MPRLNSQSRSIVLIVALAFFMHSLDSSIMNTSLPQMAHSFGVAPLDLSAGITLYLLTAAALIPVSGWLADRFGARAIFLSAILIFTLASALCGLAATLWQFTLARIAQGVGGALMLPVGRMIVLRTTDKSQLLHAIAWLTWPPLAAPVIGPALGGFLTTYLSWRWNFLLNVPIGLAGVWLILRLIPDFEHEHQHAFDWRGMSLTSGALIAVLYGLEWLSHAQVNWPWPQWLLPVVLITCGALLTKWSVRHLNQTPHALLELSSLAMPSFRLSAATSGLLFRTSIQATPYLLPLLFQVGFGMNALAAGSLVLIYFVGNLGIKPLATALLRHFGFRRVLIGNGVLTGLSIMACALFTAHTPTWIIMSVLFWAGATRSIQFTCLNTLVFADVSAAQRSSSTTLFSMFNQIAMGLGVTISTLVMNFSLLTETEAQAGLREIRIGLIVVGLICFVGTYYFRQLPVNAGAQISGQRTEMA